MGKAAQGSWEEVDGLRSDFSRKVARRQVKKFEARNPNFETNSNVKTGKFLKPFDQV